MRWRMIDRIDSFEPWRRARGTKTVSLEEYELLLPLGREAEFPESLVLESGVALARWFVMASSDFRLISQLRDVRQFTFEKSFVAGDVLSVHAAVIDRQREEVTISITIQAGGAESAKGIIVAGLAPLEDHADAGMLAGTWSEIHVAS